MEELILGFEIWFLFWVGGWAILRLLPGNHELFDRRLFLITHRTKYIFTIGLIILTAVFIFSIIYRNLFGSFNFFTFRLTSATLFLLMLCLISLSVNFLALFFIKNKRLPDLIICFGATVFYYSLNNLFQQIVNFGLLYNLLAIIFPAGITMFFVALAFSLSHFLAILEGARFSDSLKLVLSAFFIGLVFGFLRLASGSIIPGFFLHFTIYLWLNGPLAFIFEQKFSALIKINSK